MNSHKNKEEVLTLTLVFVSLATSCAYRTLSLQKIRLELRLKRNATDYN